MEASAYTGLPIPRPVHISFADWGEDWIAQKRELSRTGRKPRPSTLDSWQSDLKSLRAYFGDNKLHTITTEAVIWYVQHLQTTPIAEGLRGGGQFLSEKSIRNKVGLLSQILRSAKARRLIPSNPVIELDWKELLGTEDKYHRRYRDIPLKPEQVLHFLDVARKKYTPKVNRPGFARDSIS